MFISKLEKILSGEYGVGSVVADPTTVLWATDKIENIREAKDELKRVNTLRKKYGRIPVYVPYGHRLS